MRLRITAQVITYVHPINRFALTLKLIFMVRWLSFAFSGKGRGIRTRSKVCLDGTVDNGIARFG